MFTTHVVERGSPLAQGLLRQNQLVLAALGLKRGVSHTEFIVAKADGKVYFLETSARVGGAHIADLVEAATGVNLWAEWAKVELAGGDSPYAVRQVRKDYAGLLITLAKQEYPDTSRYDDPEIVWRMDKPHHVGFIVQSPSYSRVTELVDSYIARTRQDFNAVMPARQSPTD